MVKILRKEQALHPNKDGKLIAQETKLIRTVDGKKETIKAFPIPREELKELLKDIDNDKTDRNTDVEVVLKYCDEPKFTEEEAKFLIPSTLSNIATTIFNLSFGKEKDDEKLDEETEKKLTDKVKELKTEDEE